MFKTYLSTLRRRSSDSKIVAAASTINLGDQTIACIYKVAMETNLSGYDKDRSLYKINVATGVDLSFVRIPL